MPRRQPEKGILPKLGALPCQICTGLPGRRHPGNDVTAGSYRCGRARWKMWSAPGRRWDPPLPDIPPENSRNAKQITTYAIGGKAIVEERILSVTVFSTVQHTIFFCKKPVRFSQKLPIFCYNSRAGCLGTSAGFFVKKISCRRKHLKSGESDL